MYILLNSVHQCTCPSKPSHFLAKLQFIFSFAAFYIFIVKLMKIIIKIQNFLAFIMSLLRPLMRFVSIFNLEKTISIKSFV